MREIWKMWLLVRFFRKNLPELIDWDLKEEQVFSNTGKPVPTYLQKHTEILSQTREPRVFRPVISNSFAMHKSYDEIRKLGIGGNKLINLKTAETQILLDSCIEAGFLGKDEENSSLLYLKLRGKKFADPTSVGLLKEWAKEIGILWGGIIWIFSIIGAANWKSILDFVTQLLHK